MTLATAAWAGDKDRDGLSNKLDECPEEAEDPDDFKDDDGCPDPDNDVDGIPDDRDSCPNEPEDPDNHEDQDGCPDPDNDNDGVLDISDRCPREVEDSDDGDGCSTVTLQLLSETGWMAAVGKLNGALLEAVSDPESACSSASRVAGLWLDEHDPAALAEEWNGRLQRAGSSFDSAGANALLAGKREVYNNLAPALELLCKQDGSWERYALKINAVYEALPAPPPPKKRRR